MLLCFDVSQCRKYFEMRVFENMIVNLITTVYNFLWGDLFTIPLPGGGSLGISLLILLLIPTGIYFTIRTRFLPIRLFPDMIRALKGRIHFAHVRNLKFNSPTDFEEAAHLSSDGSFDMYQIMKALYDTGFSGPIRPDHGRMIWGEEAMPGYGLYDRALGAAYLNGLWEAIEKEVQVHGVK